MSVTLVATPGAADANSYETEAEATAYFATRLPLSPPWDEADDPTAALAMATRVLDATFQPRKVFVPAMNGQAAYYRAGRQWTGLPASATQALAWPRIGMYDQNGNAIAETVIPQALKDAQSEFAGQLAAGGDRTLDNDVVSQGISSVRAGSVAVSFRDTVFAQVLPDAVLNLMPASWFTEEVITSAYSAEFERIG